MERVLGAVAMLSELSEHPVPGTSRVLCRQHMDGADEAEKSHGAMWNLSGITHSYQLKKQNFFRKAEVSWEDVAIYHRVKILCSSFQQKRPSNFHVHPQFQSPAETKHMYTAGNMAVNIQTQLEREKTHIEDHNMQMGVPQRSAEKGSNHPPMTDGFPEEWV
ncbi:hypothetical protein WISP_84904 [Willisornis vidua]|uniref:Uncharacterized protein n=1 Tax=Willisornis vidua TaxID=1566151 RepID=A0ABQ9D3B6_9PASS|nr:hypothetical protein WISP_84904 [Willisornis vidua]